MEELFSALLSEAKSFTGGGRGRPRKEGTPQTRSGGKVASPEAISALSAIDTALAKRKSDLTALRSGETPEGWEKVGLIASVSLCRCESCGSVSRHLSSGQVFLVHRAKRNHATRHLIPVSRAEMVHYQSLGLKLTVEESEGTSPLCPECIDEALGGARFTLSPREIEAPQTPPGWLLLPFYPPILHPHFGVPSCPSV
jgi:hypothetical protein